MDLSLYLGDLEVSQTEVDNSDNILYDICLDDTQTALINLVKRTLQTPLGYITLYTKGTSGIDELDINYGDNIYQRLSEPFTSSTLLDIQSDIKTALNILSNIPSIVITNVCIYSYTIDSIDIAVEYSINNATTSTVVNFTL